MYGFPVIPLAPSTEPFWDGFPPRLVRWEKVPVEEPSPESLSENMREYRQRCGAIHIFVGDCTDSDTPRPFPVPGLTVHFSRCLSREKARFANDAPGYWYCPECKTHGYTDRDIDTSGWLDRLALIENVNRWRSRWDSFYELNKNHPRRNLPLFPESESAS